MENNVRKIDESFIEKYKIFFGSDINSLLDNLENNMEEDLMELFPKFQIIASKKTDKKSLPYQYEIVCKLNSESYVNGMLEFHRTYRKIFKALLDGDVSKIRFYVHVEPYGDANKLFNNGIKYCFRYYEHKL